MPSPKQEILFDRGAYMALCEMFKGDTDLIQPVPAAELKDFKQSDIAAFCHKQAIYQVPTTELIEWLQEQTEKERIIANKVIEIGAGTGSIGRYIPVVMTDSYIQESEIMKDIYSSMQQPAVTYGKDVVCMEASQAISHFRPDIVIGCWVTEFGESEKDKKASFSYGIEEMNFKGRIGRYIMVGNEKIHRHKKILKKIPYKSYRFDWLYSRSMSPEQNIIYDFNFKPFI